MDWLRRESAMKPRERSSELPHDVARRLGSMERKAGVSCSITGGWISGKKSGHGRNIFLDILFIERNQAISLLDLAVVLGWKLEGPSRAAKAFSPLENVPGI